MPVPLADYNPLHRLNKSGRPKSEMIDSVKLLSELTKESPLSRKALYRRAGVSSSSAIKYCDMLIKLKMIRIEEIQKNFLTRLHFITLTGKINLVAVTELNIEQFGINRLKLLRDTIGEIPTPGNPRLSFVKKFLTCIFATQKTDILERWAKETARELFWTEPDDPRPPPEPESTLEHSWFEMIPALTISQLESYLRALDAIRPTLDHEEAATSYYLLRRLAHWNPDYFDETMERLQLPELAKWLSR